MDVKEIRRERVDCIIVAQNRVKWLAVVNAAMNLWIP
jgi:hypothetical protein